MRLKKSSDDMNAAMAAGATTDEVDGLAKDLILPISKMVFLKIILFDIGISLGKSIPNISEIFVIFDNILEKLLIHFIKCATFF